MPKLIPKILKQKAYHLRQQGYSLDEISNKLQVHKSTVWYWIKKIPLSPEALEILETRKRNNGFKVGNTVWQKNPNNLNLTKYWSNSEIEKLTNLYNSGLGMNDVAKNLNRSLNSVCSIMRRKNILRRTSSETNRIKFLKSPLSFFPRTNLSTKEKQLKVAGLMLYWGEGFKKGQCVDFANSNPEMIKLFVKFIKTIYQINPQRLRVYLYSYTTQNQTDLINFWSQLTRIPPNQFTKPYVRSHSDQKHDKMEYGLVHIRYSDTRLLRLILEDIKTYSQKIL